MELVNSTNGYQQIWFALIKFLISRMELVWNNGSFDTCGSCGVLFISNTVLAECRLIKKWNYTYFCLAFPSFCVSVLCELSQWDVDLNASTVSHTIVVTMPRLLPASRCSTMIWSSWPATAYAALCEPVCTFDDDDCAAPDRVDCYVFVCAWMCEWECVIETPYELCSLRFTFNEL